MLVNEELTNLPIRWSKIIMSGILVDDCVCYDPIIINVIYISYSITNL